MCFCLRALRGADRNEIMKKSVEKEDGTYLSFGEIDLFSWPATSDLQQFINDGVDVQV